MNARNVSAEALSAGLDGLARLTLSDDEEVALSASSQLVDNYDRENPLFVLEPILEPEVTISILDLTSPIVADDLVEAITSDPEPAEPQLYGTRDAVVWVDEFLRVLREDPVNSPYDPSFLLGWFANAIESGVEIGRRERG